MRGLTQSVYRRIIGCATGIALVLGPIVVPTAAAATVPQGDQQVQTWRANYACRGYHHIKSVPLREHGTGDHHVYGWLRVYVKKHRGGYNDWCAVNEASRRTFGHKLARSVTILASYEMPRDSGHYAYYAGAIKVKGWRANQVHVSASVHSRTVRVHSHRVARYARASTRA